MTLPMKASLTRFWKTSGRVVAPVISERTFGTCDKGANTGHLWPHALLTMKKIPSAPNPPLSPPPMRSPRTSIILAELARQRRSERRRRREARLRRAALLTLFDRRPFDLICTGSTPSVVFPSTTPIVYVFSPYWETTDDRNDNVGASVTPNSRRNC